MKLTITDIQLTDDRLRKLPERLHDAAQRLVDRTAFGIEGQAKILAPVDTGFLRNSIYTETAKSSGYDKALAAAERLHAKRHAGQRKSARTGQWVDVVGKMLDAPDAPGDLAANVIVGAEYGIYVEYGTMFAPAQPFLTPAFEAAKANWEAGLRKLFEEALK